jgi:succinoglycan biosynthesis transport protein ExoP
MNDAVQVSSPLDDAGSRKKLQRLFPSVLTNEAEREGIDLRASLSVLWRRKGIIAGCAIIIIGLATTYIHQLTPLYTAQASLMLDQQKLQVLDIKSVLTGVGDTTTVVATQVEVLTSPTIAAKVAAKLHLETNPEYNPALKPPPGFSPITWVREKLSGLVESVSNQIGAASNQSTIPIPPTAPRELSSADVAPALAGRVTATNDGASFIIKIRATSENPELAAQIANAYVDAYLTDQLEAKFDATRRASAWLNDHLNELREKVLSSEHAVQLFKEQHNLSSSGTTVTSQQLSELNSQLIIVAADRAQKESAVRELQNVVKVPGALESARGVAGAPFIQTLRAQEAELMRRQAELSTRYKPEHPTMVNLKAQLDDIHQKIAQEANNAVRAATDELTAARAREASLRTTLNSLTHSTTEQDKAQVQLSELQREAQANKALYEDFLNRFKQTSVQQDIQQADARAVAAASPPGGPSYPNTSLYTSVALVVAVFCGVLVAFFIELLDNGFRTSDQLEKTLRLSTLGMVPGIGKSRRPHEVVVSEPVSLYSEAIRSVRTALRYSDVDNPPKIVLVTSSLPSEGKTVFATSLARSVARSGGRSLLIDCDLRRPGVARILGATPNSGLVDFFDGSVPVESIIQTDEGSGMHFIPAKSGTANPQDLLGSQHMKSLLEQMRSRYDLIVLDSPPVLVVSDPIILSHAADATMYIVRWEKTPRHVVEGAVKMLRTNGGQIAGAVLSRVNTRRHAAYGYGDSAYYYGRGSDYYKQT